MIVIPMAGASRRFSTAGYVLPKYMLPLHQQTVFAHAVLSFAAFFRDTPFVFIARDVSETADFLRQECIALGICDARIVMLERETAGQAETVALGLDLIEAQDEVPVTIFNIDTFRKDFRFPAAPWFANSHGYLEVFRGSGTNWSYVGPVEGATEPLVARTAEKQPISDLCCDGLYHFARAHDFRMAFAAERAHPSMPELYVAPLYNHLIAAGRRIHYDVVSVDLITFCGVPAEYEAAYGRTPAGPSG